MTRQYNEERYRAELKNALRRIDPDAGYNISELMRARAFWWISDIRSYRRIVQVAAKLYGWPVTGTGKGARYRIKGKDVSRFIKTYGPGIVLMHKLNTYGRNEA